MSYPHLSESPIKLWCIVNPHGDIRNGYHYYECHAWSSMFTGKVYPAPDPETVAAYKAKGWRAVRLVCTPVEPTP